MRKATPNHPYATKYDLTNCDAEPIHLIQTVQSFAAIIAVDLSTWQIRQVSSNLSEFLEYETADVLGRSLKDIFPDHLTAQLAAGIETGDFSEINPIRVPASAAFSGKRIIVAHTRENRLILEVEHVPDIENEFAFLNKIDTAIGKIQSTRPEQGLFQIVAEEVKNITGYDRVMIYKFDPEYNGEVIAEAKEEKLEAFLNLRYPSTDIPKQARELFLKNRVRMLVGVDQELSMIHPATDVKTGESLNVGNCSARGVSPIHLEYLRNMGVRATLSVAIIENEKLWGLIACHHCNSEKLLSYRTRNLIRFVGQIISGHLSLQRAKIFKEELLYKNIVHAKLFEQMNSERDVVDGLTQGEKTILDYIKSSGATIVFDDQIKSIGDTPNYNQIQQIVKFLNESKKSLLFSTDSLLKEFPESATFSKNYSGLLAVKISEDPAEYILWFRKPQTQEVFWGGNPEKVTVKSENSVRISPRKSFEKWKQVIEDCSEPWQKQDEDAAMLLRNDIKEIILKRFGELKKLHIDLKTSYQELESFSYTVSHDLRSPLRAIEGFSQILLEDYSDKLDSYGVNVVETIISSINKMNEFVNNILTLSKLAKVRMIANEIDAEPMIEYLIQDLKNSNTKYKDVKVVVKKGMPRISGDNTMIKQLFANLLENAVKYSSGKEDPYVEIGGKKSGKNVEFYVKDNGIGFDIVYRDKIFEVFNRLVTESEFEGTGVGLSIVKRILERHQGKIEVESIVGEGSTFRVFLPQSDFEQSSK